MDPRQDQDTEAMDQPPEQHKTEIGRLLRRVNEGEQDAWSRLVTLTYSQLRDQARAVFNGERNTLQATAILHEALLDLQGDLGKIDFQGPAQFFSLVSRVLRHKLLDHVRAREAEKRGGGRTHVPYDPGREDLPADEPTFDLLELQEALDELRKYDERLWMITELKFFCGLTNRQVGQNLGLAESTIENDWTFCKAWLRKRLGDADDTRTI